MPRQDYPSIPQRGRTRSGGGASGEGINLQRHTGNGETCTGDTGQIHSTFSDESESDSDSESLGDDSDDSQDDIPLAQRIPGALLAQRSIRLKDKADRDRKRKEKHSDKSRARAQPMFIEPHAGGIAAGVLAQRLLKLQEPDALKLQHRVASQGPTGIQLHAPPTNDAGSFPAVSRSQTQPSEGSGNANHSTRDIMRAPAFRRQITVESLNKSSEIHGPRFQSLSNSPTVSQRLCHDEIPQPQQCPPLNGIHVPSALGSPMNLSSPSVKEGQRLHNATEEQRKVEVWRSHNTLEHHVAGTMRSRTLSTSAKPPQRVLQRARTNTGPPSPSIPVTSQESKQKSQDANIVQRRLFVGDMQRFSIVEIGSRTRARDVLDLLEAQGALSGEAATQPGEWMVWEIVHKFGLERPLRDFELPAEVYASWDNSEEFNRLLIKKTPLASVLSSNAVPTSSPTFSGHVQWESKRGKWNKRWMELREHGLWLSKRENGKDSSFLCSLSNFDCYYVSHFHKAPKPFVFAVKSTDNITLFENPADYLHVFACQHTDGQRWMECILVARSYVLYKERTVLFNSSSHHSPSVPTTGTYKTSSKANASRTVPLIDANVLQASTVPATGPFQSGTLLGEASL